MQTRSGSPKRILTFLRLTLLFSAIFWALIIGEGSIEARGGLFRGF